MPGLTPNIGLVKPYRNEYYNIDIHNNNSDTIDTEIAGLKDADAGLNNALSTHIADKENPHATTAHQVGAYTKEETNNGFVLKTGDTMTGNLTVQGNVIVSGVGNNFVAPNNHGYMGMTAEGTSDYMLWMSPANTVEVGYQGRPVNIQTNVPTANGARIYHQGFKPTPREVGAVATGDQYKIMALQVGNADTETNLLQNWHTGFYASSSASNLWTNLPPGFDGAFTFEVESIQSPTGTYKRITAKDYKNQEQFVNTTSDGAKTWSGWTQIWNSVNSGKYSGVDSTSESHVATPLAVKTAYDKAMEAFDYSRKLCPYRVGDHILTINGANPAETFPGTEWGLITNRMLWGVGAGEKLGATGGASSIALTVDNLPSHSHSGSGTTSSYSHSHAINHGHSAYQDAHGHGNDAHTHATGLGSANYTGGGGQQPLTNGDYGGRYATYSSTVGIHGARPNVYVTTLEGNSARNDHNHTLDVKIGATGGGAGFNIMNPYYTVYIWQRTA